MVAAGKQFVVRAFQHTSSGEAQSVATQREMGIVPVISIRLVAGIGTGALVAAGLAAAPAIGASDDAKLRAVRSSLSVFGGIGAFTPASADPRLAALFARGGLDPSGFRFTPAVPHREGSRAITVSVQARSSRGVLAAERTGGASAAAVQLAPIAYNLGVAVGWRRFALSGDMAKVDLAGMPGSREAADVGVSYTGRRFTGQVRAGTDRPLPGGPKLIEEAPAYSVDVGGSYRLTHNLDVTAGVRYKAEHSDRLSELNVDRRDSQAVYVGTAFRF